MVGFSVVHVQTIWLLWQFVSKTTYGQEDFIIACGSVSDPIQRYDLYKSPVDSPDFTRLPIQTSDSSYPGSDVQEDAVYDPTANKIYWLDMSCNIGRSNLDGSEKEYVVTGSCTLSALEINIQSRHLYWVSTGTNGFYQLSRATLDGNQIQTIAQSESNSEWTDIYVDQMTGNIYWSLYNSPGTIRRVSADGTEEETIINSEWGLRSVAVDGPGDKLYLQKLNALESANLQGGNRMVLYESQDSSTHFAPGNLALYRNDIYWIAAVRNGDVLKRSLLKMPRDASQVPQVIETAFTMRCLNIHSASNEGSISTTARTTASMAIIAATRSTNSTVVIQWTIPDDILNDVVSYHISYYAKATPDSVQEKVILPPATNYEIQGLQPDTEYVVEIRAELSSSSFRYLGSTSVNTLPDADNKSGGVEPALIGLIVCVIVAVVIIALVVAMLWRCRKNARDTEPSSEKTPVDPGIDLEDPQYHTIDDDTPEDNQTAVRENSGYTSDMRFYEEPPSES